MPGWKDRLTTTLEPILRKQDPRPEISAYHDMPYAIFQHEPDAEFAVRTELSLLKTRLEQAGKRVTIISLAECLTAALDAEQMTIADLSKAEIAVGLPSVIEQLAELLSHYQPLDTILAARLPETSDPLKDVVFITRTGALFPFYRAHALLEQMKGKVTVPSILFYPGELDGAAGLRFMGILDADSNYRPRIF